SEDRPDAAQLAVSPTGRAAHIYLLPGESPRAEHPDVLRRLTETEGVDLTCWLEGPDGRPLRRLDPGMPAGGGEVAVIERPGARLRFRPGGKTVDLRGQNWKVDGELGVLEARVDDGLLRSDAYPDPLARVWSALTSPHAGDFIVSLTEGFEAVDWGGVTHVGGGSHGGLGAGDSNVPLLFVGCGPATADDRDQWALRDVAPVIREHFGLSGTG
ncbi:MAG TPA: hypothetical protein VII45_00915, partial [Solirubrobacterales bacterium]